MLGQLLVVFVFATLLVVSKACSTGATGSSGSQYSGVSYTVATILCQEPVSLVLENPTGSGPYGYVKGMRIRALTVRYNYMEGIVNNFYADTNVLVFTPDWIEGEGTYSWWYIVLAADREDTNMCGAIGIAPSVYSGYPNDLTFGYGGTSSTHMALLRDVSITLNLESPKGDYIYGYGTGMRIRVLADSHHYMEGIVLKFDPGSNVLTFVTDWIEGTGSYADWHVNVIGS
jgi:hypothetical protein